MELTVAFGVLALIRELTKFYQDTVKPAMDQDAELTPAQRAELTVKEEEAFASEAWQPEPKP